jgi:polysaccharide export outer membrane protein
MAAKWKTLKAAFSLGVFLSASGLWAQQNPEPLQAYYYRIGPKDLLEISVFGLPELTQTVRVAEDGTITLSLIGKVDAAGLTVEELEKKLASLLDEQYTKDARVTVFIKEYQKVSILGAVSKPGMYELVGPTTLGQIIAQAGGLTAQATEELYIYRQGENGSTEKITVNLSNLMLDADQNLNMRLHPKDVVTVPIDQTLNVFVYGEVKTPGAISYRSSKRITLLQAVAQAGGPTEWAKKSKVIIRRKDKESGKEMNIRVNLKSIASGKIADVILEEGDVIIVP